MTTHPTQITFNRPFMKQLLGAVGDHEDFESFAEMFLPEHPQHLRQAMAWYAYRRYLEMGWFSDAMEAAKYIEHTPSAGELECVIARAIKNGWASATLDALAQRDRNIAASEVQSLVRIDPHNCLHELSERINMTPYRQVLSELLIEFVCAKEHGKAVTVAHFIQKTIDGK